MGIRRREFLAGTGLALVSGAAAPALLNEASAAPAAAHLASDWNAVRAQFALSDNWIHMSAMLISSHPKPVRDAVEVHRRNLDADPVTYLEANSSKLSEAVQEAAGRYLDTEPSHIALTDSTTMGLGLVYNGLGLAPEDEILTTEHDYYVTHESLRLAAGRSGAKVRKIPLHQGADDASEDQIVSRIAESITPATRVLAVTWVHSSTGLKLPIGHIGELVEQVNAGRDDLDRVLFCVDGVHGFGIENTTLPELGCDFLIAGCHKWLFGPRGTGIVAGTERGWQSVRPTIPSFMDDEVFLAWLEGRDPSGSTSGSTMSPGGFKPFEHRWAMAEGFEFHQSIGKDRVADRTHELAAQLKEGLRRMPHAKLHTPASASLSAGIVAFDIDGMVPLEVVRGLRDRRIIASVSPYATQHVRLTPSIRNTPAEIEAVLEEISGLSA